MVLCENDVEKRKMMINVSRELLTLLHAVSD